MSCLLLYVCLLAALFLSLRCSLIFHLFFFPLALEYLVHFVQTLYNDSTSSELHKGPKSWCRLPFAAHSPLVEPLYPCYLKAASMEWAWPADITRLCHRAGEGGEGGRKSCRSGGREELRTHGGPRQLFSDSLFCNCPGGLLSSAEFQKSYETGPELDVQRLTHSDTVLFRGGGGRTAAPGRDFGAGD